MAYDPVRMHHKIEFETLVSDDRQKHDLVVKEVAEELMILGPLMVQERILKMKLEEVQLKIRDFHK